MREKMKFIIIAISIGFIWCVLLPRLARQADMKRHLDFLEDRGIDPSAMFYTELEAMKPILQRLEK